jgi:hypothetical protein
VEDIINLKRVCIDKNIQLVVENFLSEIFAKTNRVWLSPGFCNCSECHEQCDKATQMLRIRQKEP